MIVYINGMPVSSIGLFTAAVVVTRDGPTAAPDELALHFQSKQIDLREIQTATTTSTIVVALGM